MKNIWQIFSFCQILVKPQKPIIFQKVCTVIALKKLSTQFENDRTVIILITINYVNCLCIFYVPRNTAATKINRPGHNIRMHWTNFWQPYAHVKQNIKTKILSKIVVHIFTLLLASFSSNSVNYSRHSGSLNNRKNSEIDDIFLRWEGFVNFQTYFKNSLCLE